MSVLKDLVSRDFGRVTAEVLSSSLRQEDLVVR